MINAPGPSAAQRFPADPDLLEVPVHFDTHPLSVYVDPPALPALSVPAPLDHEPMIPIAHPDIAVLQTYFESKWRTARPGALLRSGAAARLARVAGNLPDGFALAVFDAWRPLALQAEIFDAAYADTSLPPGFVSHPSTDPATPPPHLTGGAVDVTLTWLGRPLALGTAFDEFSAAARASAYEATPGRVRELRRLLHWSMRAEGFVGIECEWWHFEFGTRYWAAHTGSIPLYGAADPCTGRAGT